MPYARRRIDMYIYNYRHPKVKELARELRDTYGKLFRLDNILNELPILPNKTGFSNAQRTAHVLRNLKTLKTICDNFMEELTNAKTEETAPTPASHSLR